MNGTGCAGLIEKLHLDNDRPVLVLEYLNGLALNNAAPGPGLNDFLNLAVRASESLAKIHAQGVVHCAVNPGHLLFDSQTGEVNFIDFSLAIKTSESFPFSFQAGRVHPAYISPEQTGRIGKKTDQRSDIYSLGAVFHELLTGRPPFGQGTAGDLIHAHIARRPHAPHLLNSRIPEAVSFAIMAMLAKMPEERPRFRPGIG